MTIFPFLLPLRNMVTRVSLWYHQKNPFQLRNVYDDGYTVFTISLSNALGKRKQYFPFHQIDAERLNEFAQ